MSPVASWSRGAVLRVNTQIRDEATPILYRRNCFQFFDHRIPAAPKPWGPSAPLNPDDDQGNNITYRRPSKRHPAEHFFKAIGARNAKMIRHVRIEFPEPFVTLNLRYGPQRMVIKVETGYLDTFRKYGLVLHSITFDVRSMHEVTDSTYLQQACAGDVLQLVDQKIEDLAEDERDEQHAVGHTCDSQSKGSSGTIDVIVEVQESDIDKLPQQTMEAELGWTLHAVRDFDEASKQGSVCACWATYRELEAEHYRQMRRSFRQFNHAETLNLTI